MRFRFLRTILLLTLSVAVVLVYPMMAWTTPDQNRAIIASGILSFVNLLLGYFSMEFTIDKSTGVFMAAVFGGMGLRIIIILVSLAVLLKLNYDSSALVLSLMAFYVIGMIAEIIYAMKDLGQRNARDREARKNVSRSNTRRSVSL